MITSETTTDIVNGITLSILLDKLRGNVFLFVFFAHLLKGNVGRFLP